MNVQCKVTKMQREYISRNIFHIFVQDSWTPLFWAAKLNYRQITQLLVEHGADLNHRIVNVSVAFVFFLRICIVGACTCIYTNNTCIYNPCIESMWWGGGGDMKYTSCYVQDQEGWKRIWHSGKRWWCRGEKAKK